MPRTARASVGGMWYHALNRGNRREAVFHKPGDYDAFVQAMIDARARVPLDLLGYCLMPNHFHLVLRPHTMATWAGGCSGSSPPTPAAIIAITAPRGTSGRGGSRRSPCRMMTISSRCSAMSSAMPCGRVGVAGRGLEVVEPARLAARRPSPWGEISSAMRDGWSGSMSRSPWRVQRLRHSVARGRTLRRRVVDSGDRDSTGAGIVLRPQGRPRKEQ